MERGYDVDLRSPLYGGVSREEILSNLETHIGFSDFDELSMIDRSEMESVGSFSIMLPFSERTADIESYFTQSWNPNPEALDFAFTQLSSLIPQNSIRPSTLDIAYGLMPKDTNLGLPILSRDRSSAYLYLERAKRMTDPSEIYPCVLGWRGQAKGLHDIPKQRVVWMFDHAETILGSSILHPILSRLRVLPGFSAWSDSDTVDRAVTHLIEQSGEHLIFSMDYSSFDSSVTRDLLDLIWEVLFGWFTDEARPRLEILLQSFATVGIVCPDGVWTGRDGGVPSGSALTNLVDTLINVFSGFYCSYRLGTRLIQFESLGDDSIFVFQDDPDEGTISEIMRELGLVVGEGKQWIHRGSVHYLQRWHSRDYHLDGIYRGVRSPYRAINAMLSYERMRRGWSKYLDTARWIMQMENTKWDPRFVDFVKFIREGDRILTSGVDPVTVFSRAGGASTIRKTLGIASFPYNVSAPEGVESFRTVEVLRGFDIE